MVNNLGLDYNKMKKISLLTGLSVLAMFFAACSSEPEIDVMVDKTTTSGNAVTTVLTYAPDGDYDPDCDLRVRFCRNPKVQDVYYIAELTADKAAKVEELGSLDAYNQYVVESGNKVEFAEGESDADVILVSLMGYYTITTVSVTEDGVLTAGEVNFHGVGWNTLATGTYSFGTLGAMGLTPRTGVMLQQNSEDKTLYRLKNAFKDGVDLTFILSDVTGEDEDGKYTLVRIPEQNTGYTYGSYGAIKLQDVGYWQGDDSWVLDPEGYANFLYEDYSCYFIPEYYVNAGYLGYSKYDSFIPDEVDASRYVKANK